MIVGIYFKTICVKYNSFNITGKNVQLRYVTHAWSGCSSFSELSLQNINFLHSMNQVMLAD